MRKIGLFDFPETPEEAKDWQPFHYLHALHPKVLAVATTRIEGTWCAYIKDVPGIDHTEERFEVLKHDNKLPEEIARIMFPYFNEIRDKHAAVPYAH